MRSTITASRWVSLSPRRRGANERPSIPSRGSAPASSRARSAPRVRSASRSIASSAKAAGWHPSALQMRHHAVVLPASVHRWRVPPEPGHAIDGLVGHHRLGRHAVIRQALVRRNTIVRRALAVRGTRRASARPSRSRIRSNVVRARVPSRVEVNVVSRHSSRHDLAKYAARSEVIPRPSQREVVAAIGHAVNTGPLIGGRLVRLTLMRTPAGHRRRVVHAHEEMDTAPRLHSNGWCGSANDIQRKNGWSGSRWRSQAMVRSAVQWPV